jgi:8-oxo-dGTP pyrophosphatase MutT (NUDIX family)
VDRPEVEEAFTGPLFRVEVLRWPGKRRDVVRHPGAAAVVALTGRRQVILVRQLREAVGEPVLELPAGIFDVERESPEETARRELEEETGYRAASMEPLGRILPSPGFSDEVIHLFRTRAERVGEPEDGIEVVTTPLDRAVEAVVGGRIADAKTAVGLLLAARRPA